MIGQNARHEPIALAENKDARRDPKAVGVVPSTNFAGLPYKTKGEPVSYTHLTLPTN